MYEWCLTKFLMSMKETYTCGLGGYQIKLKMG
jgi:hypothetical protein